MGYNKTCYRRKDALSDIVSIILIASVVTSAISVIMLWGIPYMDNEKANSRAESALYQFINIDTSIKDIITQGVGSKRYVNFITDAGYLHLRPQGTFWVIYYSVIEDFDFNVSSFEENSFDFDLKRNSGIDDHTEFLFNATSIDKEESDNTLESVTLGTTETIVFDDITFDSSITINIEDDVEDILIGKIWVFDLGSILYETSSSDRTFNIIIQNGAVLFGTESSQYVTNEPNIYNTDEKFVMRIIEFEYDSQTIGGGRGNYRFAVNLQKSSVPENRRTIPEYLKMQISGNQADAWISFFRSHQGFDQFDDEQGILYREAETIFSLTHSTCAIELEVQG